MSKTVDQRWGEVETWLDAALDVPTAQRSAWLEAECGDPALRARVLSLLQADAVRGSRIEARAAVAHDQLNDHADTWPEVPGYHIVRLLGEGGMASVFLAERTLGETVQQVALKRLRLNVYDRDERRRFEHEHRLLARLEHPGIARLIDAGIAPDGVPWFAMEYVDGAPMLAWCDARQLDATSRLALLGEACVAVHHAHQHLVIHRDLKPSNILVNRDGRIKVLDFGIARVLDTDDDETADRTRTELRRLTPGYAAPEQYRGQASTATDVHALGVILVELLSGQRPSTTGDSDPLRGLSITADAARSRASTPRALERLLAGDAGAIARKALRTDPAERYGSVLAFADELTALRTGRPVQARRGDWRYRVGCFARRHAVAIVGSVLVTTTLVGATSFSLLQAHRARQQAERAQAVQAFVENILSPLRDGIPHERMPPLDQLLAQGLAELDRGDERDPAVYSDLLVMFARTYDRMGEIATARELSQRAHAHSLATFGADDPRTVLALAMRGRMNARYGDVEQARADLTAAQSGMQALGIEGEALTMLLDDLGSIALGGNDIDAATALFTQAQRERERYLPPAHPDLAIGHANLAEAVDARGDKLGALALYERALQQSATQPDTRRVATYLSNKGLVQCELGRFRDGSADYRRAIAIFDRLDARDHPDRMWVLARSCSAYIFSDELDQAERDCEAGVAMAARLYGADSPQHVTLRIFRIKLLAAQGRLTEGYAEAETLRAVIAREGESGNARETFRRRALSDLLVLEDDAVALRETLLPLMDDPRMDHWAIAPMLLARMQLACARAPSADCPDDIEARLRGELAKPKFLDSVLVVEALLQMARVALHRGDLAAADAQLAEIARVAALPHSQLAAHARWLQEARLLRGDLHARRGDPLAARREWHAADAVLAHRHAVEHPLRRALAVRLGGISELAGR